MRSAKLENIQKSFGLKLSGEWEEPSLTVVEQGCVDFIQSFSLISPEKLKWMQTTEMRIEQTIFGGLTDYRKRIKLGPNGLTTWTVVHELAHAWDFSTLCTLSLRLMVNTGSWGPIPALHQIFTQDSRWWYHAGSLPPPCGVDRNFNRYEDFAESVTAFVYPEIAAERAAKKGMGYDLYGYSHFYQTPRGKFIAALIKEKE